MWGTHSWQAEGRQNLSLVLFPTHSKIESDPVLRNWHLFRWEPECLLLLWQTQGAWGPCYSRTVSLGVLSASCWNGVQVDFWYVRNFIPWKSKMPCLSFFQSYAHMHAHAHTRTHTHTHTHTHDTSITLQTHTHTCTSSGAICPNP
jgi:hypothetical protein